MANATQEAPMLYAELKRIAKTYGSREQDEFLNYIHDTELAEWKSRVRLIAAQAHALDVRSIARLVWNEMYVS